MIEVAGSEIFCNSIMIHTNTERTCWHVMKNFILYLALLQLVLKLKLKPIVHFAYCAWMWVLHEQKGWNRGRWVGLPAGCRDSFVAVNTVWAQNRCLLAENAGSLMSGSD